MQGRNNEHGVRICEAAGQTRRVQWGAMGCKGAICTFDEKIWDTRLWAPGTSLSGRWAQRLKPAILHQAKSRDRHFHPMPPYSSNKQYLKHGFGDPSLQAALLYSISLGLPLGQPKSCFTLPC